MKISVYIMGLVLVVALFASVTTAISVPVALTPYVTDMWNALEALPDGSKIFSPFLTGYMGQTTTTAVFHQYLRKHFHVVIQGPAQVDRYLFDMSVKAIYGVDSLDQSPLYGKEIVALGTTTAGTEARWTSQYKDFTLLVKKDMFNNDLKDYNKLPMLKDFKSIADAAAVLDGGTSESTPIVYGLRQALAPNQIHLVLGASRMFARDLQSYYGTGIVKGCVMTVTQAAQYEELEHAPGNAHLFVPAEVIGTIFLAGGIIVVNVAYFYKTFGKKKVESIKKAET